MHFRFCANEKGTENPSPGTMQFSGKQFQTQHRVRMPKTITGPAMVSIFAQRQEMDIHILKHQA